jgi:DNA-binding IclR family transcriptional regulator
MSSVTKVLSIFDLFGTTSAKLTADEIISKLGCSRPQGYRYIRELCAAGFLTRLSGSYSLGPRVIELDYVIRVADPLLRIAEPFMRRLRDQVVADVTLVEMFGDHLVGVHHERCVDTHLVGYGRGRPMPIFRGATYKVFIANLPIARQKQLFERYPEEIAASTFAKTWPEMRADLKKVRKMGYAISAGEVDAENAGIAVPILDESNHSVAVLALILPAVRFATSNQEMLVEIVKRVASEINHRIRLQVEEAKSELAPV